MRGEGTPVVFLVKKAVMRHIIIKVIMVQIMRGQGIRQVICRLSQLDSDGRIRRTKTKGETILSEAGYYLSIRTGLSYSGLKCACLSYSRLIVKSPGTHM